MTGQELIDWIIANHAEDLPVLIEHRDSGGTYWTAEQLGEFQEPKLVQFSDENQGTIYTLRWGNGSLKNSHYTLDKNADQADFKPNGIIL